MGRFTAKNIIDYLAPIREKRKELENNIPYVYNVLKEGTEYAKKVASHTLINVKKAMKINYFDEDQLMKEYK